MASWQEIAAAESFLAKKLREYLAQTNVPALAAVLVRDAGSTIVSSQQGIRKVGGAGDRNIVQAADRFNLGSISKVFAAHLVGALIDAKVAPSLSWQSTLGQVMPDLNFVNPAYRDVTIDQYSTHVSGMPYTPNQANEPVGIYEPATSAAGLAALHLNPIQRRLVYVQNAVKDPLISKCKQPDSNCQKDSDHATLAGGGIHDPGVPGEDLCRPGECVNYSGGQVINAAILERLTGRVFEDLMQHYIFGPLGMTRSRFGRAAPGNDDGPWQHGWNATAFTMDPYVDPQLPEADTHPRNPVGGMCCNAADLGRFLAESVRPDPRVFHPDTRQSMQSYQVSPVSSFTRGAWGSQQPGSPTADIWYEGDDGYMLATSYLSLSKKTAVGVMCNVNDTLANAAVVDTQNLAWATDANWQTLFGPGAPEPVECAHAMPALVVSGNLGQILTVFARKHHGHLIRRQSANGGQTWGPELPFSGWVMTSGLAAAATPDGSHMFLFGRGTDNQIWYAKSSDAGQNWQGSWPVPFGTFMTGPAVAVSVSGPGIGIHLAAVGMDRRMYYVHSADGGQTWSQVANIGNGTFTSAPAIIASKDGTLVRVFGRGDDFRIWNNWASPVWQPHWAPIGQGIFSSGPGAVASDNGAVVHVMARGTDRNMWQNWTTGLNTPFQPHWQALAPKGNHMSAPSLALHGNNMYAAAFGDDFAIGVNHSADAGSSWAGAKPVGPQAGPFL